MIRVAQILLLLAALSVFPLEMEELVQDGYIILPWYKAIIIDGYKCSDGRRFIAGFDLQINRRCLYVLDPRLGFLTIERFEYKERK